MAAKNKFSWLKWLVVLAVASSSTVGFYHYRGTVRTTAPVYKTIAVTRGDITQLVTANGQLGAVKSVQVGSQISGTITEIKADFNAHVKEGETIAQIDPSTYDRSVDEAAAEVASAQAALELSQLTHKRTKELRENNLVSQADLEKAVSDLHQAEAALKIREASLKRAKVDLERTTIYAPISGVVISRSVEVGQTVAASFSTPTLFVIANDLAKMQIEAAVSEADVGGVADNQAVDFTVDAYQGRKFQGTVRQVRYAPSTNQNIVTYTTIIAVNNSDLKLRPGMTANASIITAQRQNVLRIPNAALRFRLADTAKVSTPAGGSKPAPPQGGSSPPPDAAGKKGGIRSETTETGLERTVYVLKSAPSPSGAPVELAQACLIRTGTSDGTFTEVLSGLGEGDQVITGTVSAKTAAATGNLAGKSPFSSGGPPPR